MIDFLIAGGPVGMFTITILGIFAVVKCITSFVVIQKQGTVSKQSLDTILFLGSLSFFIGILWQIIGLFGLLSSINELGEMVSPLCIMAGIKVSLYGLILGAFILLITGTAWFILRWLNNKETKA